jgi:hypothetical protein
MDYWSIGVLEYCHSPNCTRVAGWRRFSSSARSCEATADGQGASVNELPRAEALGYSFLPLAVLSGWVMGLCSLLSLS